MVMNYADPTAAHGQVEPEFYNDVDDHELEKLLTHASRLVRKATRRAIYDTDPAGNPTDIDTIETFREATCLQVEAWVRAGVHQDVGTGGAQQPAQLTASSENGASLTFNHDSATEAKQHLLSGGLAPAVELLLDTEGYLSGTVGVRW